MVSATLGRFDMSNLYQSNSKKEMPRVSPGSPGDTPPPPKSSGDYCFRAEGAYVVGRVETMKFVGYSKDFDIVDKVQQYCARHKDNIKYGQCKDVKLFFMGSHPKCDGRVESEKLSDKSL